LQRVIEESFVRIRNWGVFAVLVLVNHVASAAIFCVNSPAALQTALNIAASNGEQDTIRVVSGTYALSAPLTLNTSEHWSVGVYGRWDPACTAQNGAVSVLDGQGQFQVLALTSSTNTPISISQLSISGGHQSAAASASAAGAAIYTFGDVRVDNNFFFNNRNDNIYTGGLAVYVGVGGNLYVHNNVFLGNQGNGLGAADLFADGTNAYANGNTVIANTRNGTGLVGGVFLRGNAAFALSNNLLWNNNGGDLYNGFDGGLVLLHNDIGVALGYPPGAGSTGNFSRDPLFASGFLNLRPSSRSPLINAGTAAAPGNIGSTDVTGAQRMQLPQVDIGAYESDVIFYGSFELP